MKKFNYHDNGPIAEKLRQIYLDDPDNNEEAMNQMILYIFFKAGLLEDGISVRQFDAAYDAWLEANEGLAKLIDEGIASV